MANTKISLLSAGSALGGTEVLAGVQGGANVKVTADQLKTYCAPAVADVGVIEWPIRSQGSGAISGGTVGTSMGSLTFDSATDRLAYAGRSMLADSIASVSFRTGTVTTGATLEMRIESVTAGRPSGTLINAGASATVIVADTDDNVWKTVTLTTPATLTKGQAFAIVLVNSSGLPNLGLSLMPGASDLLVGHFPSLLQDTGAGTWGAPASGGNFCWIVGWTVAGVQPTPGLSPVDGRALSAYASTSSPNEKALKFTAPMRGRVSGVRVSMANTPANADFTLSLWPATSSTDAHALAQLTVDADYGIAATTDGYFDWLIPDGVTLTPGAVYYVGVRADTINNGISVVEQSVPAGITNAMKALWLPQSLTVHKSHRTWTAGTAGAWTDTATTLPSILLLLDRLGA